MSRAMVLAAALAACSTESEPVNPDARPQDASTIDAPPEFFGEPCTLSTVPEYPDALVYCRGSLGLCYDEDKNGDRIGTCRPFCMAIGNPPRAGCNVGIETWTSPGNAGACVCLPP